MKIFAPALLCVTTIFSSICLADIEIAGLNPSERPAGAPTQQPLQKDNDWYRMALTGVSAPYPYSLRFLEDQGNWYTPFTVPGMPGYYNIRGW